jgi:hypothetical protein
VTRDARAQSLACHSVFQKREDPRAPRADAPAAPRKADGCDGEDRVGRLQKQNGEGEDAGAGKGHEAAPPALFDFGSLDEFLVTSLGRHGVAALLGRDCVASHLARSRRWFSASSKDILAASTRAPAADLRAGSAAAVAALAADRALDGPIRHALYRASTLQVPPSRSYK